MRVFGREESALSHHESALSHHESALSHHESALSHHESALSHHESALSHHESALSREEPTLPCLVMNLSREEANFSRHEANLSREEANFSRLGRGHKVRSSDLQGSRAGDLTQSRKVAKTEGEEGNTAEVTLSCHAERSEASFPVSCQTLRVAQGDMGIGSDVTALLLRYCLNSFCFSATISL